MLKAIMLAHVEIKKIVEFIESIVAQVGKPKLEFEIRKPSDELVQQVREFAMDKVLYSLDTFVKAEREERREQVKSEVVEHFKELYPNDAQVLKDVESILYDMTKEIVRDKIINHQIRPDGRKWEEIRPIWSEVGLLPRTHGSAVFTRTNSGANSSHIGHIRRRAGVRRLRLRGRQELYAPIQYASVQRGRGSPLARSRQA